MYLRQVGVVPILSCMENIELWCVGEVEELVQLTSTTKLYPDPKPNTVCS